MSDGDYDIQLDDKYGHMALIDLARESRSRSIPTRATPSRATSSTAHARPRGPRS
jgi:hypothetical protein